MYFYNICFRGNGNLVFQQEFLISNFCSVSSKEILIKHICVYVRYSYLKKMSKSSESEVLCERYKVHLSPSEASSIEKHLYNTLFWRVPFSQKCVFVH